MNNIRNRFISKEEIEDIVKPVKINNLIWYQRAFACQCFTDELKNAGDPLSEEDQPFFKSNETLETVGDVIIGAIIVEYLEERFPNKKDDFISIMKTKIVKTDGLSLLARKLNFDKFVLLSCESEKEYVKIDIGDYKIYKRNEPEILENCFEALVGALFSDFKYAFDAGQAYLKCKNFLINLIEKYVDLTNLIIQNENYKTISQEYLRSRDLPFPEYSDIYIENDSDSMKIFSRGIYMDRFLLTETQIYNILEGYKTDSFINNRKISINKGNKILVTHASSYIKKKADQICAKNIIMFFSKDILNKKVNVKGLEHINMYVNISGET